MPAIVIPSMVVPVAYEHMHTGRTHLPALRERALHSLCMPHTCSVGMHAARIQSEVSVRHTEAPEGLQYTVDIYNFVNFLDSDYIDFETESSNES